MSSKVQKAFLWLDRIAVVLGAVEMILDRIEETNRHYDGAHSKKKSKTKAAPVKE